MSQQAPQQSQQQQTPPAKGTPEYNQMMVEAYEKQGGAFDPVKQTFALPPQKAEKPAEVPDKFWNAEKGAVDYAGWAKSTKELEAQFTKSKQGQQPTKEGEQPKPDDQAAQDAVANAGLKWDDLGAKLSTQGKLDETDYAALAKAGIPKEIVDDYIGAKLVAQKAARAESAKYVGGEQVLDRILERASQELSPEEREAYNAQLRNPKTASAALDALKAKFADGEPGDVLNGGGGSAAPIAFQSAFEQNNAINKKDDQGRRLYDVDPAYRQSVRARIAISKF